LQIVFLPILPWSTASGAVSGGQTLSTCSVPVLLAVPIADRLRHPL
jgi:hypothetical protein